jgi:hypothetical protein
VVPFPVVHVGGGVGAHRGRRGRGWFATGHPDAPCRDPSGVAMCEPAHNFSVAPRDGGALGDPATGRQTQQWT